MKNKRKPKRAYVVQDVDGIYTLHQHCFRIQIAYGTILARVTNSGFGSELPEDQVVVIPATSLLFTGAPYGHKKQAPGHVPRRKIRGTAAVMKRKAG